MAREVSGHTATMLAAAQRRGVRRGLLALAGACVLLVTVWALVLPGVTMANATFCGQEEHEHSIACYQQVLTCGFDDGSEGGSAASSGEFSSGVSDAADGEQSASAGSGAAGEGQGEGSTAASSGAVNSPDEDSFARGSSPDSSASSAQGASSAASESAASAAADTNAANAANAASAANAATPDAPADAAVVSLVSDAVAAELPASSSAASSSGHVHSEACYESVLVCEVSEHEHSLACYSDSSADLETEAAWEATLPADDDMTGNWAADVLAVADSQLGYKESTANYSVVENAAGTEAAKGYTRYGAWWGDAYGDWCAMFVSFCLSYAGVPEEVVPQDANCQNWIEALSAEGVWLWRPVEAVENAEGAAQRTGVAVVPAEVVAAWEAEAAELAELAGETAGGEAASTDTSGESASANTEVDAAAADPGAAEGEDASGASLEAALLGGSSARYTALGSLIYDPQPGDLVFFDWDDDGEADHVGFVYELLDADGSVVAEAGDASGLETASSSAVAEGASGDTSNTTADAAGVTDDSAAQGADATNAASSATAVKLKTIEGNVSDGSADAVCYREYDLTDSSILGYASLPENPETQVATLALDEPMLTSYSIKSATPTLVESASTSDFIDLNLYDYNGYINEKYNDNKNYPGFQWNGGAYMYSNTYNRHSVDYIDFGNSNITDRSYGGSDTGIANGKSRNAVIAGVLYTKKEEAKETGAVNWLWWDGSNKSITNRPVGVSTMDSPALSRTLGDDGYPALADGASLAYLFTDTNGGAVTKQNTESIDGLFQKNEATGEYYYNSRWNHAQYSENKFTLYNQIITPNFIVYPFGNFLPFNDITNSETATQVSSINGNGGATVSDYIQSLREDMSDSLKGSPTKTQLTAMLEKYQNSIAGTNIKTSKDAIVDYFTAGGGSGDNPSSDTSLINDELLAKMYNIDWDEETNFFFGMDMTMNFMQPKDGLTGNDGKQPMEFYFTGDDDVWVYIDGVLFLDLTGIHRHVGGKIDFVNGVVEYYALDTKNGGDVSSTPYKTYTFAELLEAAGKSTDGLNGKGAFKDYSTHQFKFYYMERGSGSSVCRMNFNFPLLKQNTISVSKEVATGDVKTLGNPDYQFQILKADESGNKTNDLFIGGGKEYTIYDSSDNEFGTGVTDSSGIFTLKAGQRAEFAGIEESDGKYYVRELVDSLASGLGQYGEVTVSGVSATFSNDVKVGSDTFVGMDSPVKDISDGATKFQFVNALKLDNPDEPDGELGALTITKKLTEYQRARTEITFNMQVTLDDALLPDGTVYTVVKAEDPDKVEDRVVAEKGIVSLAADETATISGILLGSEFTVKETSDSAKGYTVTYPGNGIETDGSSASGIVGASSGVSVLVENSENGASVSIPIEKKISNSDGSPHEFKFKLIEVSSVSGEPVLGSEEKTASLEVESGGSASADSAFVLSYLENSYLKKDDAGLPADHYYKVFEYADPEQKGTVFFDEASYVIKVTVSKSDESKGIVASVSEVYKDGTLIWTLGDSVFLESVISFTNTLAGSLEISKTVEGTATGKSFEFEVALSEGKSGLETLPEYYDAEICSENGSTESGKSVKLKLVEKEGSDNEQGANSEQGAGNDEGANSKRVLKIVEENSSGAGSGGAEECRPITLQHDQRIIIEGIPYGTEWTVTEVDADGFIVQTQVVAPNASSEGASAGEDGEGGEASGEGSSAGSASGAEGSSSSTNAGAGASAASGETPAASSGEPSAATVSGSIAVGSTQVDFTNTQMYQLPETGGVGVVVCVLAGLALMGAALLGMRRIHRRGEAV